MFRTVFRTKDTKIAGALSCLDYKTNINWCVALLADGYNPNTIKLPYGKNLKSHYQIWRVFLGRISQVISSTICSPCFIC